VLYYGNEKSECVGGLIVEVFADLSAAQLRMRSIGATEDTAARCIFLWATRRPLNLLSEQWQLEEMMRGKLLLQHLPVELSPYLAESGRSITGA